MSDRGYADQVYFVPHGWSCDTVGTEYENAMVFVNDLSSANLFNCSITSYCVHKPPTFCSVLLQL